MQSCGSSASLHRCVFEGNASANVVVRHGAHARLQGCSMRRAKRFNGNGMAVRNEHYCSRVAVALTQILHFMHFGRLMA